MVGRCWCLLSWKPVGPPLDTSGDGGRGAEGWRLQVSSVPETSWNIWKCSRSWKEHRGPHLQEVEVEADQKSDLGLWVLNTRQVRRLQTSGRWKQGPLEKTKTNPDLWEELRQIFVYWKWQEEGGTGGLFLIRLLRNIWKGDSDQALNLWLWRSCPSSEDQILGEEFLLKCLIWKFLVGSEF